jgi:hypothetical protein
MKLYKEFIEDKLSNYESHFDNLEGKELLDYLRLKLWYHEMMT